MKNVFQKKTLLFIVTGVLVVFAIVWYARPRSFADIMTGLDLSQISLCEAEYFISGVDNGQPTSSYQKRSFEPNSNDYEALLQLLCSTTYRRQFANIFTDGTSNAYSITLNPHVLIYFYQGDAERYEFWLLGEDVPAGPAQGKSDYTPWGGKDFQRQVVAFICEHGILTEEN